MTTVLSRQQIAKVFDALSDPTRLGMVELLTQADELSSSEIAERLDISLALFCHHIKPLHDVGLVHRRQEAQTKFLSLNRDLLKQCLSYLIALESGPHPIAEVIP